MPDTTTSLPPAPAYLPGVADWPVQANTDTVAAMLLESAPPEARRAAVRAYRDAAIALSGRCEAAGRKGRAKS